MIGEFMRILLVEDDLLLGDGLYTGLSHEGYTVDWLKDGASADQALKQDSFDLIILDLGLPKLSGLDVLQKFRKNRGKTPVLILTAQDSIDYKVKGLNAGADDYLTKPFDLDELCARLRALQRRKADRASSLITHGSLTLDPNTHRVTLDNEDLHLSRREFALLQKLLDNAGIVLSKESLGQTLYGWGEEVDSNALEVHIHNLRKKLGNDFIKTVRGIGYLAEKPR
jgi:two-component system, OmpR family, response regulator QseB